MTRPQRLVLVILVMIWWVFVRGQTTVDGTLHTFVCYNGMSTQSFCQFKSSCDIPSFLLFNPPLSAIPVPATRSILCGMNTRFTGASVTVQLNYSYTAERECLYTLTSIASSDPSTLGTIVDRWTLVDMPAAPMWEPLASWALPHTSPMNMITTPGVSIGACRVMRKYASQFACAPPWQEAPDEGEICVASAAVHLFCDGFHIRCDLAVSGTTYSCYTPDTHPNFQLDPSCTNVPIALLQTCIQTQNCSALRTHCETEAPGSITCLPPFGAYNGSLCRLNPFWFRGWLTCEKQDILCTTTDGQGFECAAADSVFLSSVYVPPGQIGQMEVGSSCIFNRSQIEPYLPLNQQQLNAGRRLLGLPDYWADFVQDPNEDLHVSRMNNSACALLQQTCNISCTSGWSPSTFCSRPAQPSCETSSPIAPRVTLACNVGNLSVGCEYRPSDLGCFYHCATRVTAAVEGINTALSFGRMPANLVLDSPQQACIDFVDWAQNTSETEPESLFVANPDFSPVTPLAPLPARLLDCGTVLVRCLVNNSCSLFVWSNDTVPIPNTTTFLVSDWSIWNSTQSACESLLGAQNFSCPPCSGSQGCTLPAWGCLSRNTSVSWPTNITLADGNTNITCMRIGNTLSASCLSNDDASVLSSCNVSWPSLAFLYTNESVNAQLGYVRRECGGVACNCAQGLRLPRADEPDGLCVSSFPPSLPQGSNTTISLQCGVAPVHNISCVPVATDPGWSRCQTNATQFLNLDCLAHTHRLLAPNASMQQTCAYVQTWCGRDIRIEEQAAPATCNSVSTFPYVSRDCPCANTNNVSQSLFVPTMSCRAPALYLCGSAWCQNNASSGCLNTSSFAVPFVTSVTLPCSNGTVLKCLRQETLVPLQSALDILYTCVVGTSTLIQSMSCTVPARYILMGANSNAQCVNVATRCLSFATNNSIVCSSIKSRASLDNPLCLTTQIANDLNPLTFSCGAQNMNLTCQPERILGAGEKVLDWGIRCKVADTTLLAMGASCADIGPNAVFLDSGFPQVTDGSITGCLLPRSQVDLAFYQNGLTRCAILNTYCQPYRKCPAWDSAAASHVQLTCDSQVIDCVPGATPNYLRCRNATSTFFGNKTSLLALYPNSLLLDCAQVRYDLLTQPAPGIDPCNVLLSECLNDPSATLTCIDPYRATSVHPFCTTVSGLNNPLTTTGESTVGCDCGVHWTDLAGALPRVLLDPKDCLSAPSSNACLLAQARFNTLTCAKRGLVPFAGDSTSIGTWASTWCEARNDSQHTPVCATRPGMWVRTCTVFCPLSTTEESLAGSTARYCCLSATACSDQDDARNCVLERHDVDILPTNNTIYPTRTCPQNFGNELMSVRIPRVTDVVRDDTTFEDWVRLQPNTTQATVGVHRWLQQQRQACWAAGPDICFGLSLIVRAEDSSVTPTSSASVFFWTRPPFLGNDDDNTLDASLTFAACSEAKQTCVTQDQQDPIRKHRYDKGIRYHLHPCPVSQVATQAALMSLSDPHFADASILSPYAQTWVLERTYGFSCSSGATFDWRDSLALHQSARIRAAAQFNTFLGVMRAAPNASADTVPPVGNELSANNLTQSGILSPILLRPGSLSTAYLPIPFDLSAQRARDLLDSQSSLAWIQDERVTASAVEARMPLFGKNGLSRYNVSACPSNGASLLLTPNTDLLSDISETQVVGYVRVPNTCAVSSPTILFTNYFQVLMYLVWREWILVGHKTQGYQRQSPNRNCLLNTPLWFDALDSTDSACYRGRCAIPVDPRWDWQGVPESDPALASSAPNPPIDQLVRWNESIPCGGYGHCLSTPYDLEGKGTCVCESSFKVVAPMITGVENLLTSQGLHFVPTSLQNDYCGIDFREQCNNPLAAVPTGVCGDLGVGRCVVTFKNNRQAATCHCGNFPVDPRRAPAGTTCDWPPRSCESLPSGYSWVSGGFGSSVTSSTTFCSETRAGCRTPGAWYTSSVNVHTRGDPFGCTAPRLPSANGRVRYGKCNLVDGTIEDYACACNNGQYGTYCQYVSLEGGCFSPRATTAGTSTCVWNPILAQYEPVDSANNILLAEVAATAAASGLVYSPILKKCQQTICSGHGTCVHPRMNDLSFEILPARRLMTVQEAANESAWVNAILANHNAQQCVCAPGYTGQFCEKVTCNPPCQKNGTCVVDSLTKIAKCICPQDSYKRVALVQGSYCQGPVCNGRGTLVQLTQDTYKCTCDAGYKYIPTECVGGCCAI